MKKKLLSLLLALTMVVSLAAPALAEADKYAGIETGAWYETAAKAAVDNGYMTGTDKGFEPQGTVTRAQVYQIFYNLEGRPEAKVSTLADTAGKWYADAAGWAEENGLIAVHADADGRFPSDNFDGEDAITRAEVAQIIWRYLTHKHEGLRYAEVSLDEKRYIGGTVPAQYQYGAEFCLANKIMVGDEQGNWNADKSLTRAEFAQIMSNYTVFTAYTIQKVTIQNDGRDVVALVTIPAGEGKFPAVVMNHGHGGSKDENVGFAGVARALADQGIATIRMDFPGCGESTEPFTENYLSNMISDSNACIKYLVENYPVDAERLGILGYSMGGRIAATIAGEKDSPYKAMVLLAGAVSDGRTLIDAVFGGVDYDKAYAAAKSEGKYTLTTAFGQKQDLSKTWFDELVASKPLANAKNFTGPVLVMYGDKDTTVPAEVNKLSLTAYPQAVEVVVKDADHGYGFYSDQSEVTAAVEGGIASFFAVSLCDKVSSDTFLAAPGRADWFATGKQAYSVTGMTVSKETAVHNKLEDADYAAQPGTDVVLTGTVGEQWVTPMEKVLKTYTKQDGSALTADDFTADKAVTLYAKAGTGNFACFVPAEIKVEVQTAWGDVLQANRDGVPHGKGDYLVCSAGEDGQPDLSDVWVVNGEVFSTTYQMPASK